MAKKNILPPSLAKYSEAKILKVIGSEYEEGMRVARPKRLKFREQEKLLNDARTNGSDEPKIDLKMVQKFVNTILSVSLTDKINVRFFPRQLGGDEIADNLNKMAEYDYDVMDKFHLDMEAHQNRIMRGVGIMVKTGWNGSTQVPIWQGIDTRQWVPDPNVWSSGSQARYHGFETSVPLGCISDHLGYDTDRMKKAMTAESSESTLTRVVSQINQGLGTTHFSGGEGGEQGGEAPSEHGLTKNGLVDLYHHMTIIEGRKYMFSTINDRKVLVRAEEFEAEDESAKEDPTLIEFPVVLYYYDPEKYNPFGRNLIDAIESQHRYMNVLVNLNYIKDRDAAVGTDVMYNKDIVCNASDFTVQSEGRKFIPVLDVNNAVAEIPKSGHQETTDVMISMLKRFAQESAGIDEIQMGVQGDRAMTASEAQQLQQNNNVRTALFTSIWKQGERDFWRIYYRTLKAKMKAGDTKFVRVTDSMSSGTMILQRNEFICAESPDVQIMTQSEINSRNDMLRAKSAPIMMMQLQDPTTKPFIRTMLLRQLHEMNGRTRDEAIQLTGQSATELRALYLRSILDKDDQSAAVVTDLMEDHETYLEVFRSGVKTDARAVAMDNRIKAIISRDKLMKDRAAEAEAMGAGMAPGGAPQAWQPGGWQGGGMANMAMSQALQRDTNQLGVGNVVSRQNVAG